MRLNREVGAFPLVDGNRARVLAHHDEQIEALVASSTRPSATSHVEFYILILDDTTTEPFFAALARAVERGVTVRVLLDHLGDPPVPRLPPDAAEPRPRWASSGT